MLIILQVVDKNSEEANIIMQYVKNTHAATHNTYTLEVQEVSCLLKTLTQIVCARCDFHSAVSCCLALKCCMVFTVLPSNKIFKIGRQGERQRFHPFEELHNRQLLWHGSRATNYAGILSQGLRIAPPEAPVVRLLLVVYYICIVFSFVGFVYT